MTKENNKVDINKHEMDIDTLKKQNVNDLLSIKEIYSKLEELGEKITKIKYIDNTLVKKIKKEYENLNKIILDENIQVQLDNKIDEFNLKLTHDIETINSHNSKLTNDIETINSHLDTITNREVNAFDLGLYTNENITEKLKTIISSGLYEQINFNQGNYIIDSFEISNQIILNGNNTSFISNDDETKQITLKNNIDIRGMTLNKVRIFIPYNNNFSINIESNYFKNCDGIGAIFGETGYNRTPVNVFIQKNKFENNEYSIKGGFTSCNIQFNTFQTQSTYRNIEINAGAYNIIGNNTIKSGVTGIAFLIDASIAKKIPTIGNNIFNNTISDIEEEGISFDVYGNVANKCSSYLYATVTARLEFSQLRLQLNKTMTPNIYAGTYAYFLNGTRKGKLMYINDNTDSFLQLDDKEWETWSQIVDCDIIVCTPFILNKVYSNTLKNVKLTGIHLYGNCFDTVVEKNNLYNCNIKMSNISGLITDRKAICSNNNIKENMIINSKIESEQLKWGDNVTINGYNNNVTNNTVIYGSIKLINEENAIRQNNHLYGSVDVSV